VDRDQSSIQVCESSLRALGYEVEIARDVYQAVDALGARHFDLVLADVALPEVGGLLKCIREQGERTPIVLMQEEPSVWAAVHALRLGVADYLQKPLRPLDTELALIKSKRRPPQHRAAPGQANRRLLQEVEELRREATASVREMEALRAISTGLTYTKDEQRIIETGLDFVFDLLEPEVVALTRLGTEGAAAQLFVLSRHPLREGPLQELKEKVSSSLARWLPSSLDMSAASLSVVEVGSREDGASVEEALVSFISVPMTARVKLLGSLSVAAFGADAFSGRSLKALSGIANNLSLALELAVAQQALVGANLETIAALGAALEARDRHAYGHAVRDARFAVALAERMGLSEVQLRNVQIAALLHDIGKFGVSDRILNKRGSLTPRESQQFRKHPVQGAEIIAKIGHLREIAPLVRHHHERFDGSGYPDGLAREEIPLEARILAVADAFGAMTDDRAHRPALSLEVTLAELKKGAGTQFDPQVLDAFLSLVRCNEGRQLLAETGIAGQSTTLVAPVPLMSQDLSPPTT
jgi:putative nucleotidyltransferase with HDIG domain